MTTPMWQVDAFTDEPFRDYPAAVSLLDTAMAEDRMQQIALEMNLLETAFVLRRNDGFLLRWFTPARGGVVRVTMSGDRVLIGGSAVTSLRGELLV